MSCPAAMSTSLGSCLCCALGNSSSGQSPRCVDRKLPCLKAVKTLSFPLCCGSYAGVVTPEVAGESKSTQSLSVLYFHQPRGINCITWEPEGSFCPPPCLENKTRDLNKVIWEIKYTSCYSASKFKNLT